MSEVACGTLFNFREAEIRNMQLVYLNEGNGSTCSTTQVKKCTKVGGLMVVPNNGKTEKSREIYEILPQ
jgi:hypothetical protein